MKKRLFLLVLFFFRTGLFAQLPPPPATVAETIAGTVKNKFISPYTASQAGLGTNVNTGINRDAGFGTNTTLLTPTLQGTWHSTNRAVFSMKTDFPANNSNTNAPVTIVRETTGTNTDFAHVLVLRNITTGDASIYYGSTVGLVMQAGPGFMDTNANKYVIAQRSSSSSGTGYQTDGIMGFNSSSEFVTFMGLDSRHIFYAYPDDSNGKGNLVLNAGRGTDGTGAICFNLFNESDRTSTNGVRFFDGFGNWVGFVDGTGFASFNGGLQTTNNGVGTTIRSNWVTTGRINTADFTNSTITSAIPWHNSGGKQLELTVGSGLSLSAGGELTATGGSGSNGVSYPNLLPAFEASTHYANFLWTNGNTVIGFTNGVVAMQTVAGVNWLTLDSANVLTIKPAETRIQDSSGQPAITILENSRQFFSNDGNDIVADIGVNGAPIFSGITFDIANWVDGGIAYLDGTELKVGTAPTLSGLTVTGDFVVGGQFIGAGTGLTNASGFYLASTNETRAVTFTNAANVFAGTFTNKASGVNGLYAVHDANGKIGGTANGSSWTNLTLTIQTNVINTGVIPVNRTTYTNLTGNITIAGFSGVDLNGDTWANIYATNASGAATPRSITFAASVFPSTNTFVLDRVVWVTNAVDITVKIRAWSTNLAAVRWSP